MKKLVLFLMCLLLAEAGFAQATYTVQYVQNGGFPNNTRTGSILDSYGWKEILPPAAMANTWSANQTIPFAFQFYGAHVTKLKVSGNLLVTFDTTAVLLPGDNTNMPNSSLPDKTVAVFWDDFSAKLPLGTHSKVLTKVFGTAPNRQFWIVWFAYQYGSDMLIENSFNACVLEEGTNKIYVVDQYTQWPAYSTTVGLQLNPNTGIQVGDSTLSMEYNSMAVSDIDYYTFTPKMVTPADAGISTIVAPVTGKVGCYTTSEDVQVTITNYGSAALTSVPVTVTVSGAITQTISGIYNGNIAPGDSVVFTVGQVNLSQGGSFTFAAATQLSGDGDAANDAYQKTVGIETLQTLPSQTVTFTGYDGDNLSTLSQGWYERPGAWLQSNEMQTKHFGTKTARVYMFNTYRRDWIVSPRYSILPNAKLYFKAAVTAWDHIIPNRMGVDDSLNVMVSTDCGATFTTLRAITDADTVPNTLTQFVVDLAAYAGQEIVLAFYATDGDIDDPLDYSFHIDDIQVKVPGAVDAGIAGLVQPQINGCPTAAETVEVTITNTGSTPLANIPVTVNVTGAAPQTIQNTFVGPLAPGGSATFVVGTINMTIGGRYNITATAAVANDADTTNNSFSNIIDIAPSYALPLAKVTFTGYDATNLEALTNNTWRQFSPNGSWAGFTTANADQIAKFGTETAKVNLFASFKDEWLYGPKFRAVQNAKLYLKAAVTQWSDTVGSVMGGDDSVRVMVSTDCGVTYQMIGSFNASTNVPDTLTQYDFDLSAFAGQDIMIALNASDGLSMSGVNYDFHVDDIQVKVLGPVDGALTNILTPLPDGCYTSSETVEIELKNDGSAAISNIPVTVTTTGAIAQTITSTYTGTLAPGASANFIVGTIDMSAVGNYNITALARITSDSDTTNNFVTVSRTLIPANTLPLAAVTFDGYDGFNLQTIANGWYESDGAGMPATGVREGNWEPSDMQQTIGLGSQTAKVNMAGNATRAWMIGPKVMATNTSRIAFKAAVTSWDGISSAQMGADDSLHVMFSTDCGVSFKPFRTISAANQPGNALKQYDLSLAMFAGNEVVLGFYADNGTSVDLTAYDIHVDDIEIREAAGADVGVVAITPVTGCALGTAEPVTIEVVNYGTTAQQNIPVYYSLNGNTPVAGAITATVNPGDTVSYTFAGTVNLSQPLTYNLEAYTALTTDTVATNHTLQTTVTSVPTHQVLIGQPVVVNFEDSTLALQNFKTAANTEAGILVHVKGSNPASGLFGLVMEGKTFDHWYRTNGVVTPTDAWVNNYKHHAYASMCVDASSVPNTQLELSFDLKQTFSSDSLDSWFRVLVNGVQVSRDFNPLTPEDDTMKTHTIDLSLYAGTNFEVTFQSSNKFAQWQGVFIGNDALVDNIRVSSRVVGVKEQVAQKLVVYPNPTTGLVTIDLGDAEKAAAVEVYSMQGQLLYSKPAAAATQHQLDLSAFTSGIYIVKVTSADRVLTQKVVLQK
ncbi:MAG: choice-of-anchor J domain-containing protein [Hymenobacteraceae bacterium]|nr:choice-of-anchor J domain-containing protein [Hymenobacteraceae bacterium]MDX5513757.1 choice-of-anchor J domain-containing protein [Hymenobacteraceae bacterium]